LAGIAVFAVFTLVFTLPGSIPTGPSLSKFTDGHRISLPKIPTKLPSPSVLNPFRPAAHAPPVQANSTSGDSRWHQSWKWLSPFSSSITLDENRSVLPPLVDRPRIYTYYDAKAEKDDDIKSIENDILLIWRRAWWAQGFKPLILGPAEAMNNPIYEKVQRLDLPPTIRREISSWLAWENMGGGILCNFLALPMGPYEDPLLSYLRRGEYPDLTRYDALFNGLFVGSKAEISAAIQTALSSSDLSKSDNLYDLVPLETFKIDNPPKSIAYYATEILTSKFAKISDEIKASKAEGLKSLTKLLNAHLHNTWQNTFSEGIAVLKPIRTHMTAVIEPAVQLAEFLAQCPESPITFSCPPNLKDCKPCVASTPMKISAPPHYRNNTKVYIIGVVPHPWTTASLEAFNSEIDVPFIRRETERDHWLITATKELLGTGVSTSPRLVKFKEAVASPYGTAHSVWFTAERDLPDDLDWHFGFMVPRNGTSDGRSETPVPGPERRPAPVPRVFSDDIPPSSEELAKEMELLDYAKMMGRTEEQTRLIKAVEAWNLADVEAWRFARAFMARHTVERQKWEEEEKKVTGGAGSERGGGRGWFD
jgi:hypothetical protein